MTSTTTNPTILTIEIWESPDPSTTTTLSFKLAEVDGNLHRQYIQLGNMIKTVDDLDNLIVNLQAVTSQEGLGIEPMSLQLQNYSMAWKKGAWKHDIFVGLPEWGFVRIKRCYDIDTLKIHSFGPTFTSPSSKSNPALSTPSGVADLAVSMS